MGHYPLTIMSFLPQPTESIELATLQGGRAVAAYSVFEDDGKVPNQFTIYKGRRCLIQLFDRGGSLVQDMRSAFNELESGGGNGEVFPSERFLLFLLGRGESATSRTHGMPELDSRLATRFGASRRNSVWRLVRLKGWSRPSILILQRIYAASASGMGRSTKSTYNWAKLSLEDANQLREALLSRQSLIASRS